MPVTREIVIHATLQINGNYVKMVQVGNKCVFTEDVETRGDTFRFKTGMSPIDDFVDWWCIKHYGINLN